MSAAKSRKPRGLIKGVFPNPLLAVPPWLQYNERDPPHQIKLTLRMYRSTLTGIIRRHFIIQYSDIVLIILCNLQRYLPNSLNSQGLFLPG